MQNYHGVQCRDAVSGIAFFHHTATYILLGGGGGGQMSPSGEQLLTESKKSYTYTVVY